MSRHVPSGRRRHPIAIPFRFCRGAVDYQDRSPEETLLHGWMLHPEIEFEAALLAVDGRVAGEEPLFHRADIDVVFPSFAGRKTGFRFDHLNLETRGHELSVIGVDAAGRMAALTVCPADGRGDAARSSATPDAACGRDDRCCHLSPSGKEPRRGFRENPTVLRCSGGRPDSRLGMGPGRLTATLVELYPRAEILACDVDREVVAWARNHINSARFDTCAYQPPLPYSAEASDVVIGCSVMTHLTHRAQQGLRS